MSDELLEIAPELDRWVDDRCIVTLQQRMEADEVIDSEEVANKLLELAQEVEKFKSLLTTAMEVLKEEELEDRFFIKRGELLAS